MLKLKGCPKCSGDVQLDRDQYGWYEQCFQCGYLRDLPDIAEVEQQPANEKDRELSVVRKRDRDKPLKTEDGE